ALQSASVTSLLVFATPAFSFRCVHRFGLSTSEAPRGTQLSQSQRTRQSCTVASREGQVIPRNRTLLFCDSGISNVSLPAPDLRCSPSRSHDQVPRRYCL